MATKARRGGSLATILNANTSAASNTVVIDSGGDISLSGSLTVTSGVIGYATNTTLQATFAQNTAIVNVANDRLQVANAAAAYVTKSTALTSNNALVNLINDRYQVANADVKFVTKSVQLTSNNSLVNLINDRIQAANVSTTLGTYWPSANVIAYTNATVAADTKYVNTSIFIATGGENRVAIPYTNTNYMLVYLNGVLLTEDTDYVAANNVHIGGIDPVLAAGDVLLVEEYKNHNANTQNRTPSGGGGGGGGIGGSVSGYNTGGTSPGASPDPATVTIEKFSFTSDGNSTDVGDATVDRDVAAGQSSSENGYTSGGGGQLNVIDKFPFSSDTNASDVGDLTQGRDWVAGQHSSTNGYASSGTCTSPYPAGAPFNHAVNTIDKFPFSSDSNATDVGDLVIGVFDAAGQSSLDNGYVSGGQDRQPFPAKCNTIQKYPFSSDTNATDVGDLTIARRAVGQSSSSNGYTSGEQDNGDTIDKFPFSSDTNATDVGDLTLCRARGSGQSSTTNGYTSGGGTPLTPTFFSNVIDKFPFSSDSNATDVGDLLNSLRNNRAGQQV